MAQVSTSECDADVDVKAWTEALEGILSQPGSTTAEASEIFPWLLLGGKPAAEDAARSGRRGVTHILNCCEPWCADGPRLKDLRYAGFEAYDEPGYSLLKLHYNDEARPFLDEARAKEGRCLVHCAMGVNRSAAIVVAYLVDRLEMDLLSAVELVKKKRGCVLGNPSFRDELVRFSAQLGRLGNPDQCETWRRQRPPTPEPDPLAFGAPPDSWREYPLVPGILTIEDDTCIVTLDDGTTDCVPLGSPDICAMPAFN